MILFSKAVANACNAVSSFVYRKCVCAVCELFVRWEMGNGIGESSTENAFEQNSGEWHFALQRGWHCAVIWSHV